jgi:ATP-dependent DNA ligase
MRRRRPFQFVAFDVLALNGKDVRKLELADRKKLLRAIVPTQSGAILFAQHVDGRGRDFFKAVCDRDFEGIIAKRKASPYDPASRSAMWLKINNRNYSEHVMGKSSSVEWHYPADIHDASKCDHSERDRASFFHSFIS